MKRLVVGALLGICVAAVTGCGDDDDEEGSLPGTTPCEKWRSLSQKAGCAFPDSCDVDAACNESAIAWLECTATDIRQCMCAVMTEQLNCAGSYQSGVGPALCTNEWAAFNQCQN